MDCSIRLATPQPVGWQERFFYAMNLLRITLSGGGALDFVAGNGLRLEQWFWPGYLAAVILAVFGCRYLFSNASDKRLYSWLIVFLLLLTALFVLTKSATGGHHSSVISGVWQLTLAPLLGAFLDAPSVRQQWLRPALFSLVLILVFTGSVIANMICTNAFIYPTNPNWDPANTQAALFACGHRDARFISSDWGLGTQVVTLTRDHPGIDDTWPLFTKPEYAENYVKTLTGDKDIYIYTRLPGFEAFKGNRANLLAALEKDHITHEVVRTYSDWRGMAMIEIWKVSLNASTR